MPSPSVTPKPKVPIAQASNTASSSWPHPSNVLEAAVAVRPASFIGAKAKHPLQPTAEQVSPKHQFAPLAPLSTISEIPKMELLESDFAPEPPASIGSSQQTGRSDQEESTKAVEPSKSGSMNEEQAERHRAQGFARPSNVLSFGPPAEAASIPLPQSPTPNNEKDSTDGGPSLSPEHASKGPQELDPGLGESNAEATDPPNKQDREEKGILASILPQFMANQLPRQDTGMASTRTARSTSVAPGAYPESDSMEDTPIPTPDPNSVATQAEAGQSETSPSQADSKSIRSRKSVSIVLPEQHREPEDQQETDADTSKSREGARADLAALKTQEDDDRSVEAKQSPRNDWPAGSNQQREANQEEGRNENAVAERKGPQEVKQGKNQETLCTYQPKTYELRHCRLQIQEL